MIKSYWLRILLCGIAAAILGFLIGLVTPKQYDAVLQVLVAPYSPQITGNLSEADESVRDIISASAPRSVSTQVEQLTSYGVIQNAAQQVAEAKGLSYRDPGDELNWTNLEDRISITAQKESDIVTVHVRMSKPEIAQAVAEQMYLAFVQMNDDQSKSNAGDAINFLKKQYDLIQTQLSNIEEANAKAKLQYGIADYQAETTAKVAKLRDLEMAAEVAHEDELAAEATANGLAQQIKGMQKDSPGQSVKSLNPEYSQIIQTIITTKGDREQALERYMEDSEVIKSFDRRLALLAKQLNNTPKYSWNTDTKQPDPMRLDLERAYKSAMASTAGARLKAAEAKAAVTRAQQDVDRLPLIEQKLNAFTRQQAVLERISALYTTKLKTLEYAGRLSRPATRLVTQATAIPRPAIPNYGLNVGLGLFLGLAVGFLWSIGTEAKRNPIRSLGQLNRLSLQPCYRVIPELRVPMRGLNRAPAEVFDALLVNYVRSEKKGYRLGVLGVTKNAGATTTAMNLAIAAARAGNSVLYVELDPGNNALSKLAPDAKNVGSNITIYNASVSETGHAVADAGDLERAAVGKDLVIFDFPPVKQSGDAFLLANQLDEIILLVRASVTKSVDFLQAQQALIDAGCPLVTVSLSRVQDQSDDVSALEQQAENRAITPRE